MLLSRATLDEIRRTRRGHVPALDGIRGLAILLVLVHNAGGPTGPRGGIVLKLFDQITDLGWIGVQLFFVLSGYLITGILLDTRGAPRARSSFYGRRILRIFPLYYATLLACFVVVPLVLGRPFANVADALSYVVFLSNWTSANVLHGALPHFWSLAVEEQFYAVWPLAVFALPPRAFVALSLALVALAPIARASVLAMGLPAEWAYQGTFGRVDALALGGLTALVVRDEALLTAVAKRFNAAAAALLAGTLGMVVLAHGFGRTNRVMQIGGYSLLAGLFAASLLATVVSAAAHGPLARFLGARPLRVLGKYSYAIYIVHLPLVIALKQLSDIDLGAGGTLQRIAMRSGFTAVVLGASLAFATASYYLFERRFLDLKRYFVAGAVPGERQVTAPGEPG